NKEIVKLQNRLGGTEKLREEFAKIKFDANYYEKAYFLSIAEDLLKCLKESF
ncbi:3706_t:CDS:1, partial [Entrophospora sp. SA101]